jgi:acyl-coenzyme A synthetase/AMP-(fatty) acid ligase
MPPSAPDSSLKKGVRLISPPGKSLREHLSRSGDRQAVLWDAGGFVSPGDLLSGTRLGGCLAELAGLAVLIATRDQLATASALIELDGVASRVIISPPDIPLAQFPTVIARGSVEAIVSDYEPHDHACPAGVRRVYCGGLTPGQGSIPEYCPTEWVLLTSGTTGAPKMIVHSLRSLTAAIESERQRAEHDPGSEVVWGTFYDIRRYGGLQIFLRALLGNASMVLSSAGEPVGDFLVRLGEHGVTHVSGTPSHWRRALMSPQAPAIAPHSIRLSGEIADQAILNALRSFYPNSSIRQAFASTEAGVAFEVKDCLAGFPASFIGKHGDVEMRVVDDSLQIRSNRTASRYIDGGSRALANEEGFVDTDDMVELRGGRYYFLGRRNGVINVGGLKVFPEEIEAVINRHPAVQMSLVQARRSPIMGSLVCADIVLKQADGSLKQADGSLKQADGGEAIEAWEAARCVANVKNEILAICRESLPAHKVPASIRCVPALKVAAAGKLARQHA